MFYSTHKGADSASVLYDPEADFKSCGASVGLCIKNVTDVSSGLITAVTETTISCTLTGGSENHWDYGDTYAIYKTATYNSEISRIHTDKRAGHKVTSPRELMFGCLPEDVDLDENQDKVWGHGQPVKVMGD